VLLPDPVVCFAGARYAQEQQVHVDAHANLVLVEWLTAGRIGAGERWQMAAYTSRLKIWRDDRLILHDALVVTPEDGELAQRMGRFNCLALVILVGAALRAGAAHLAGAIGSAPAGRQSRLLLSAASLDSDGTLIRVVGLSVEQVGTFLRQHLGFVSSLLGDDPWGCRW
jgi:urease accessory protein